jgi:hypothetical protein
MFYNRFTAVALAGLAGVFLASHAPVCCRFKNHAQRLYTRQKEKRGSGKDPRQKAKKKKPE